MAVGRPKGATVSQLKLPPNLRAVRGDQVAPETMNSKLSPTRPTRPAGLPDEVAALWDSMVDDLDEAGLLTAVDGPTLELALRHYLSAARASDDLLRDGSTMYDEKNERTMKNPASQVFRDHSAAFLEFAKQLGLSFVARARVTTAKGDANDEGNPFRVTG